MKIMALIIAVILGMTACTSIQKKEESYLVDTSAGVKTGGVQMIPVSTPRGTFHVWTKRVGNNPKIKVLLLHGGPGATHEYFECFDSFLPAQGIEYYYYDQLGSLYSDQPSDTSLWTVPRFVEEVEQVGQALNLDSTNFYLLGQSWGGILAMEYALKYQQHLKGLIISNMMASAPDYGAYADHVLALQMKPEVLDELRSFEEKGDYANPRYMELLVPNYYCEHICRMPADEWPEPLNRAFAHMNPIIYTMMQGPSEFGIGGSSANWDRKKDLSKIEVPTLVIGAGHDTMDPKHMQWMSTQFPKGEYLFCPEGSHLAMYDDQETYFKGLIQFLRNTSKPGN